MTAAPHPPGRVTEIKPHTHPLKATTTSVGTQLCKSPSPFSPPSRPRPGVSSQLDSPAHGEPRADSRLSLLGRTRSAPVLRERGPPAAHDLSESGDRAFYLWANTIPAARRPTRFAACGIQKVTWHRECALESGCPPLMTGSSARGASPGVSHTRTGWAVPRSLHRGAPEVHADVWGVLRRGQLGTVTRANQLMALGVVRRRIRDPVRSPPDPTPASPGLGSQRGGQAGEAPVPPSTLGSDPGGCVPCSLCTCGRHTNHWGVLRIQVQGCSVSSN